MSFSLKRFERKWVVYEGKKPVAEIHLDYLDQVGNIVLYADASDDAKLTVLRLAAWHIQQYVKNRSMSAMFGLMTATLQNTGLTTYDSHRLMDLTLVNEEVQKLDSASIEELCRRIGVEIITAVYDNADDAVAAAISAVGIDGISCVISPPNRMYHDNITVQLSVKKPHRFTFWKSLHAGSDLHIVPGYHPEAKYGYESVGMINGDTDAYISNKAIVSVMCPRASQADRSERHIMRSWVHTKHPYYATGRRLLIDVDALKIRAQKGVDDFTAMLRATLGLNKTYIVVSGGFRAPMKCAHNRLNDINRKSPWPRADYRPGHNVARGSESSCVWEYRTLEAEGELASAKVPSWFKEEGWLDIYDGAEVRPGLF